MDLHAYLRHQIAHISAVSLGNRRQKSRAGKPASLARGGSHVDGHGTGQRNRAGGKGLGLHLGQHAAHIGMVDDGPLSKGRAALLALHCIGQRLLKRGLGNRDALHPDAQPCVVHHGEHGGQPLVRRTYKPAFGPVILHHRRGRAVQPQLMLKADDLHAIARAQGSVRSGNDLRHHEEADPARPFRRVRQSRQDQVADVVGEIIVGPRDVNFLPADRIGAIR